MKIINCRFKSFFKNVKLNKLFNDINNNMIGSSCLASSLGYDGSAECIPIILYYLDHNIR